MKLEKQTESHYPSLLAFPHVSYYPLIHLRLQPERLCCLLENQGEDQQ